MSLGASIICFLRAPLPSPDCHPLCQQCAADLHNTGSICLRCQNPQFLLLGDHCVPECPSGYYAEKEACKSKFWTQELVAPVELLFRVIAEKTLWGKERERGGEGRVGKGRGRAGRGGVGRGAEGAHCDNKSDQLMLSALGLFKKFILIFERITDVPFFPPLKPSFPHPPQHWDFMNSSWATTLERTMVSWALFVSLQNVTPPVEPARAEDPSPAPHVTPASF